MKIGNSAREQQAFLKSTNLFGQLAVIGDQKFRSAAMNMAIDEALLETATSPVIRFYRWDHSALSFGYFGRLTDVEQFRRDRDLVRRWTGGGIVLHGGDLTYSIVIPATDSLFAESSMSIYEKIHRAICMGFSEMGQHATVAGVDDPGPGINDAGYNHCFSNPVHADVMLNGKKIAGAAQRRTKRGLLQQGSIQSVHLGNDFEQLFARALSAGIEQQPLNPDVARRAEQIAADKYATEAWLRKR
jgi:lipoate-protein ligase A